MLPDLIHLSTVALFLVWYIILEAFKLLQIIILY